MKASTVHSLQDRGPVTKPESGRNWPVASHERHDSTESPAGKSVFFNFIDELRRRQVCRAITMYAVILWLICQVVDLLSPELGLPDWTLRFVLLIGLIGLPVALILAWLFDLTPNGIVVDPARGSVAPVDHIYDDHRVDQIVDATLVIAALVICLQLAVNAVTEESAAPDLQPVSLVILPFEAASGFDARPLANSLRGELQHRLATNDSYSILAARDPQQKESGLNLVGTLSATGETARLTIMLVDNVSGEVRWSRLLEQPYEDPLEVSAKLAERIIELLPGDGVARATEQDTGRSAPER